MSIFGKKEEMAKPKIKGVASVRKPFGSDEPNADSELDFAVPVLDFSEESGEDSLNFEETQESTDENPSGYKIEAEKLRGESSNALSPDVLAKMKVAKSDLTPANHPPVIAEDALDFGDIFSTSEFKAVSSSPLPQAPPPEKNRLPEVDLTGEVPVVPSKAVSAKPAIPAVVPKPTAPAVAPKQGASPTSNTPAGALPSASRPSTLGQTATNSGAGDNAKLALSRLVFDEALIGGTPVFKEVSSLYATGKIDQTRTLLEKTVEETKLPPPVLREVWLALFDLYEIVGDRVAFDRKFVSFAQTFDKPFPVFNEKRHLIKESGSDEGNQELSVSHADGKISCVLGAVIDESLGKVLVQVAGQSTLKVFEFNFSLVGKINPKGSSLMLELFKLALKNKADVTLVGAEKISEVIKNAIELGRNADPQSYWLLLMQVYLLSNQQALYEETALNYCITYEISPPDWSALEKTATLLPAVNSNAKSSTTLPVKDNLFSIQGKMVGGDAGDLKNTETYLKGRPVGLIVLSDLLRIDPQAASRFHEILLTAKKQGTNIYLCNPSPLILHFLVSLKFTSCVTFAKKE